MKVILAIDDEVANLMVVEEILSDYKVIPCKSAKEGLAYLAKKIPDMILLDLLMPEMNGFETMQILKENPEYAKIPVIFLTAHAEPDTEARCFEMGAEDFIGKPFEPKIVQRRVKRTLDKEEYKQALEGAVQKQAREISFQAKELLTLRTSAAQKVADFEKQGSKEVVDIVKASALQPASAFQPRDLSTEDAGNSCTAIFGGAEVQVPAREILYVEVYDHACMIRTIGTEYKSWTTLGSIQSQLGEGFLRTGQSFLVNMDRIQGISHDYLVMENGMQIKIPRRNKKEIIARVVEHKKNK